MKEIMLDDSSEPYEEDEDWEEEAAEDAGTPETEAADMQEDSDRDGDLAADVDEAAEETEAEETEAEKTEAEKTDQVFRVGDAFADTEEEPRDPVMERALDSAKIRPQMNPFDLSSVWHFAVSVSDGEDPMEAAKTYIRNVSAEAERPIPQNVTSITGEELNGKDILQSFDSMLGKTIIVLEAGKMETRVIEELTEVIDPEDRSLLMVLVDTPLRISELYREYPKLKDIFTSQFMQTHYTAAELLRYANSYADRQDCVLDQAAELAFMERAEEILENPETDKKMMVENLINDAIEEAEHKSRSIARLFSVRYDKEGRLILTGKQIRSHHKR